MTTFEIDLEIDKLVDKSVEDLKIKIKKAIVRSEKQTLNQYIVSQKGTITMTKNNATKKDNKKDTKKVKKTPPKREQDYTYRRDSGSSSSDYDSDYSR
jgi:hypothetical protein